MDQSWHPEHFVCFGCLAQVRSMWKQLGQKWCLQSVCVEILMKVLIPYTNSFLSNELAQPVTIVQNLHIKRTTAYVFDHQKYLDSVIIVTSDIQRTTYSKIGGNTDFIFYI